MSIPTTYNNYYGDETRWFIGTVIQVSNDPEQLGRVKVRIYGVHPEDEALVSIDDLPWASVVLPSTEAGTSGFGGMTGLKPSAQVFGIFLDGKNSQLPLVLGSIPKKPSSQVKHSRQVVDRNGYYQNSQNYTNWFDDTDVPDYAQGGGIGTVTYSKGIENATRNKKIQPELFKILENAAKAAGVTVVISSGGQDVKGHGTRRTGSTRHDLGYAADILVYDGKRLCVTNGKDPVMNKYITELGASGAQGLGAHPRYMGGTAIHVDLWGARKGGEMWGEGGIGSPPRAIINAFREGKRRFQQKGYVDVITVQNKAKEKSQEAEKFEKEAEEAIKRRVAAEGATKTNVGETSKAGFEVKSSTVSKAKVQDEPVVAEVTSAPNIAKKLDTETNKAISAMTGGTRQAAAKLDEVIIQASPAGMAAALKETFNVSEKDIPNIVKEASALTDQAVQAILDVQAGGIEKILGDKAVEASRKISKELGMSVGVLENFGTIASGVGNILPNLMTQAFNQPGLKDLTKALRVVGEGVELVNALGVKAVPPPVMLAGGVSNLARVVSEFSDKSNTYIVGLKDSEWKGANTRGTQLGGSYEFKTLTTTDHIEAELRFASNQREITSLIIDWSGLSYGDDDYTVDEIHYKLSEKHQNEYGVKKVGSNPTSYGLQTHMYIHQSGMIKRVVPPKNKINALKYPMRQKIYDNCIHITLNASKKVSIAQKQRESLDEIIKIFIKVFPGAEILGVNDLLPEKESDAPGFTVSTYVKNKFGKDTTIKEIPVKEIPPAKELTTKNPATIIQTQASFDKLPKPDKIADTTLEGFKTLNDFKQIAESFSLNNLEVLDLLRRKAEQADLAVLATATGITPAIVATLDTELDLKLNKNLKDKMDAMKAGFRWDEVNQVFREFDEVTNTFKDVTATLDTVTQNLNRIL